MEQQPSYVLRLSLTEIVLRRVVVGLCNQTDILASIVNFRMEGLSSNDSQNAWRETVQEKVKVKVSALMLPEELKTKIMHIVKPISGEMLNWKRFHENYLRDSLDEFGIPVLEKLFWTSSGTVEYQKSAKELIRCEMLDIVERYKLACLYCLEDYIHVLWKELPENVQKYFYNKITTSNMFEPSLQFCWPYILKGEESKLINILGACNGKRNTFPRYAFEYSSSTGNKAVAEYFLPKLTIEEREAATCNAIFELMFRLKLPCVYESFEILSLEKVVDTLCYLFSLINRELQVEICKEFPYCVLLCFLQWPYQDLFFDIADRLWDSLSAEDYFNLLRKIATSFKQSEYYFPKIFREFVTHIPVNFIREYIDRECDLGSFIRTFSFVLDPGTIKVIFGNLDAAGRVRLLSSEVLFYVFYGFVISGLEHTVEVWLRESGLSREDKNTVRKAFIAFLRRADEGQI